MRSGDDELAYEVPYGRKIPVPQVGGYAADDLGRCLWIDEIARADLYRRCTREQEFDGIGGIEDASNTYDRYLHRAGLPAYAQGAGTARPTVRRVLRLAWRSQCLADPAQENSRVTAVAKKFSAHPNPFDSTILAVPFAASDAAAAGRIFACVS